MAEHLPLARMGVEAEHERHKPSSEQVVQSEGQGTQRPSLSFLMVPVGQVATQSPVAVAYSPGLIHEEHCVALVWQDAHLVLSQAACTSAKSFQHGGYSEGLERKRPALTFTRPVDIRGTFRQKEPRLAFLDAFATLQDPSLLTGGTDRVVPYRSDRERRYCAGKASAWTCW